MELFVGVLGSGSAANAYIVKHGTQALMVDSGFSLRETRRRLRLLNVWEEEIKALILTHSHEDHVRGAAKVSAALGLSVYHPRGMPTDYWDAPPRMGALEPYCIATVEGWSVFPFATSHDSGISAGYTLTRGGGSVTIITDTGLTDDTMLQQASESDVLILESNYSEKMLDEGFYPDYLKQRIKSRTGHLSNKQAGGFLAQLSARPGLKIQEIFLVHLSDNNNTPQRVVAEIGDSLKGTSWEKIGRHIAGAGDIKTACGEPRVWVLPKKACWGWKSDPAPGHLF